MNYTDRNLTNVAVRIGYINLLQTRNGTLVDGLGNEITIIPDTVISTSFSENFFQETLSSGVIITTTMGQNSVTESYASPINRIKYTKFNADGTIIVILT